MSERRYYSSTRSNAARKIAAALLPCPCYRCGRIVTADMQWNADHPVARVHAEAQGVPTHEQDRMVVPSHRTCDATAGAKTGNELRAKAKAQPRKITPIKRPQLEFLEEDTKTPAVAIFLLSPAEDETPQEASDDL